MIAPVIVHGGLLTLYEAGEWRGVLIQGPSGAGKSDLALRALELGFVAVSDDRTLLWPCQGRLYGACPGPIAGLIEARGLGVMPLQRTRRLSHICLITDCLRPDQAIERMPELEQRQVLGVQLPVLRLHALEPSAPLKLRRALSRLGAQR